MYVAPRYLGRGSWLARRDPRVLLVSLALFVFTVIQVWDLRILAGLAAVAYLYYRSAGIPFSAVRPQWGYIAFFITFVVLGGFWFSGSVADQMTGTSANVLHYVSFQSRMNGFMRGLVDTRDIVFFLSVTVLSLMISFRALERRKWA